MANSVVFILHGGGPLPILGDENHLHLIHFLSNLGKSIPRPKAVIVISAHWEEPVPTITSGAKPELIYDYYGFPQESYDIKYPAAGNPELATLIQNGLKQNAKTVLLDSARGFDHGMFVPLKLVYPEADIPVIQISLQKDLNPEQHIELGRALAKVSLEDVLILGSGSSFHNLKYLMTKDNSLVEKAKLFNHWLQQAVMNSNLDELVNWADAPHAKFCHPREEHLLPLMVCAGFASELNLAPELIYDENLMGMPMSGFSWN